MTAALTDRMNDCPTSWIIFGHYEPSFMAAQILSKVPYLERVVADDDGFARNPDEGYRWILVDSDGGSAAFVIPPANERSTNDLRTPILSLEPLLRVTACIYGNVNEKVWQTLGDGPRRIVSAQTFLTQES